MRSDISTELQKALLRDHFSRPTCPFGLPRSLCQLCQQKPNLEEKVVGLERLVSDFVHAKYAWATKTAFLDVLRVFWAWLIRREVDGRFLITLRWETGTSAKLKKLKR